MTDRDRKTAELAALLEREGVAPARAAVLAALVLEQHAGAEPGTIYGGLNSLEIGRVWEKATFAGVRRLVLEVEAAAPTLAEDEGTITVRVLDSEKWPEWSGQDEAAASGVAALLADWSEVDYLANGEEHPEVWTPPGEVGGRLEAEQEAEARARAERKLN